MAAVLHHSRAAGTAKLVLLGIANHDGDGGAWPTVATLAKYANVHERNVQRALGELVDLGEVEVIVQDGGTHRTRPQYRSNLYRLLVDCPADCDGTTQHRSRGGAGATPRGGAGVVPGVALAPPEPSLEPTSKTRGLALPSGAPARAARTTERPQVHPQPVHNPGPRAGGVPAGTCPGCYLPEHDGRCAPVRSTGRPPDFRAQVAAAAADPDRPRTTTRRPPPLPDLPQSPTEEPTP